MNITFVHLTVGGRGYRLARSLAAAGHRVRVLWRFPWPDPMPFLDAPAVQWVEGRDLRAHAERDTWTEVYHVSQEPRHEWMPAEVLAGRGKGVAVVLDLRDPGSMSARVLWQGPAAPPSCSQNLATLWETLALRSVDGLVHVSPDCQRWLEWWHPEAGRCPSTVVWSAVSAEQLTDLDTERQGMVYCGNIGEPGSGNTRDYVRALEGFRQVDPWGADPVTIHLDHPEVTPAGRAYQERGFLVLPRVPQEELTRRLSYFRWGLWANTVPMQPLLRAALPNKLFEYLAAGTVPVVLNCPASASLVRQWGVGVAGDTLLEVLAQMTPERWEECHAAIRANRQTFTMEAQVPRLVEVYRRAAQAKPRWRGLPDWMPPLAQWDPGAREVEDMLT